MMVTEYTQARELASSRPHTLERTHIEVTRACASPSLLVDALLLLLLRGGRFSELDRNLLKGFGASVEITLALAQTTRNGVPAGNREHTLKGSISGSKMTGAVETVMFGSVASGDLDLTKM